MVQFKQEDACGQSKLQRSEQNYFHNSVLREAIIWLVKFLFFLENFAAQSPVNFPVNFLFFRLFADATNKVAA